MSTGFEEQSSTFLRWVDRLTKPLVIVSVTLYLLEEELSLRNNWENSLESPVYFLWCERVVAVIFTLELLVRWWRSSRFVKDARDTSYPYNVWGGIDLISIAPFWIGFLVPTSWLGLVRTLRILRFLKFFRYSRNLQLTALKFYRAFHNLRGVAFSYGLIWLFFSVVCLKLEHPHQPEEFNSLLDAAWFTMVTATTVGYGDVSPVGGWGKLFVGLMLIPIISSVGMAFAAFTNACEAVQKMEDDPEIDPIQEWRKERQRMRKRQIVEQEYQIEE